MKKITLINPPQLNSVDDRLDPPLGLMYLAAVLEKEFDRDQVVVEICDLASRNEGEWESLIPDSDIYGFTLFSASFNTARKISQLIREKNKDAIIVAGGPHATSLPENTLSTGDFDHVAIGHGEHSFVKFIENILNNKENPKILPPISITNLDLLPLPARHLVDMSSYTREVEGEKATSLITSRGCPNQCSFCCKDVHGQVKFRSVDSIIEEIKHIIDTYGIKSFLFYDDIFTLNRSRLGPLCDEIKKLNISFRCNGRAGINTLEDYQKLYEAGCKEIAFGIESGSQKILNLVNKGTTIQQNYEAITNAKKAGLLTKAYLMVGFPGETQETVDETKKFMEYADPDKFTVFMFVPLPGCEVWKNPKKFNIRISSDWDQFYNIAGKYEGGISFESDDITSEEIKRLHDDLVHYLLNRGQRGKLQSYYANVGK